MATTEHFYTGNGSTTTFAFTFPYLANTAVKVELDNVLKTENSSGQTNNDYTISNTNIVFNSAPSSGVSIHIYRNTNVDAAQAVYAAGSSIRASDLNNNQTQVLYAAQEDSQLVRQSDLKDGIVNSAKITDGSIVNVDVNASAAIAGTKISPDFGSQNIATTGTVDGRDVSVDGTKLDTIETNAKDDQTASEIKTLYEGNSNTNAYTDAEKTKLSGIETAATADQTSAEIRTLVDNATDSNVFTDADHTKLNGIEASATADQTVGEIKTLIAGSPLDASHLAANSVTSSELAADSVDSSELVDGSIDTSHIAGAQVTDAKLASNSVTTSKITDANVTTVKVADANITLAKLASDLKQTSISDSDTQLPTSGAVVDYVAAQIAPIGGLEVIATEVAFPNTQPSAGVVISISDAGGTVFNGSGVSTTGRTVGGSTVTINNAPSSLNGETLAAGVGLMVSSTGSSQTYNYHKVLVKESDVKQLSDDINDFASRYRVGSSNPTSSLDSGDLFFNTGSGKLLVYNGTNSAWEEAQSIGQYFINTISSYTGTGGNSASFNGSAYRFVLSNPGTTAEQHIVSINGVVQKPNSGTSQPSEGFVIDGSSIIFSSAPPSGADFFIITIGSTVNIGTPSNGTVSTDKLTSGAVTTAKIADQAVTLDKLPHGDGSSNGKFLRANNGADPTFESVITDLVNDTSPQLGGHLSGNTYNIDMGDSSGLSSGRLTFGAASNGDLRLYHDGSNSYIEDAGTGHLRITSDSAVHIRKHNNENIAIFTANGAVELYHDNSKKLETDSTGSVITGRLAFNNTGTNLHFADDQKAAFGTGQDLQIFHDGSNSYIREVGTGNLFIESPNDIYIGKSTGGAENCIVAKPDGAVQLYYNNQNKFSTESNGVTVRGDDTTSVFCRFTTNGGTARGYVYANSNNQIGFLDENTDWSVSFDRGGNSILYSHWIPDTNNSKDLGSSSARWRNVYTNDLNLSNEGSSNDVDGTWGDWTIQEGESDLFLKNNRSGKKYKFNLTEVS